jgi:predicted PurR-regulated permease PerM
VSETPETPPIPASASEQPSKRAAELPSGVAPIAPDRRGWVIRLAARWLLVALALYAISSLLMQARSALTPFIIGLILAYLLLPLVNWLNQYMPRWVAILLVYIGLGTVGTAAFTFIVPPTIDQIRQLIASIPSLEELEKTGADLLQWYRINIPAELREPIDEAATSTFEAVKSNLSAYAQSAGGFVVGRFVQVINTVVYLVGLLIIPIWLFYVLNDQSKGSAAIDELLHPAARPDFWNVWSMTNSVLSNYVRGQLILGLAVAAAVGIGLTILRLLGFQIPYILLLSILAGFTELVPIIGPIIGAIPAVIIGFSISPAAGVAVLILYIVIQQLENNFLVPRIVGESIGIHPAVLTVVLLAMGQVFGIVGIILSAPLAAILRDLFVYAYQRLSYADPASAREAVHETVA